jgi:hypothetical protein
MQFKLQENSGAEYRRRGQSSERSPQKNKAFLCWLEILATYCDPRPCDKENTTAAKVLAAAILPFMAAINPAPVAIHRT